MKELRSWSALGHGQRHLRTKCNQARALNSKKTGTKSQGGILKPKMADLGDRYVRQTQFF